MVFTRVAPHVLVITSFFYKMRSGAKVISEFLGSKWRHRDNGRSMYTCSILYIFTGDNKTNTNVYVALSIPAPTCKPHVIHCCPSIILWEGLGTVGIADVPLRSQVPRSGSLSLSICIYIYELICEHIYIYIYMCMYVCVYIYIYIYTYAQVSHGQQETAVHSRNTSSQLNTPSRVCVCVSLSLCLSLSLSLSLSLCGWRVS